MQVFKFRNCLLNTVERSVIKDHEHVDLTTKTFDVLQYLIENAGRIVSKDEILGHVWNGDFVEESNLPVHISKLRRSLGETRDNKFIETVQGTGYRFVSPVHLSDEKEWQKCTNVRHTPRVFAGTEYASVDSIAVFPFRNETGTLANDYLTDGLTETLINCLSHFPNLKVIARDTVFRYKNSDATLLEVGHSLGALTVLAGRVRLFDNKIWVSVELVRVPDGTQIWGEHYHREFSDIISLQEEIATRIAEKLELKIVEGRRGYLSPLTRNAESYRFYLRGKFHLERRSEEDLITAATFFEKSLALDSDNIHAYVELVDTIRLLHLLDFISYADCCDRIDGLMVTMPDVRRPIDVVEVMYCDLRMLEWRFADAEKHCLRALSINQNSLKARLRYSDLLLQSRNVDGALEQLQSIMTIDPLSPLTHIRTGRLFFMAGLNNDAIAYLNDALELDPSSWEALSVRGAVYLHTCDYERALRDFEASLSLEKNLPEVQAMIGVINAKQGKTNEALQVIRLLQASSGNSIKLAHIYLALNRKEETYRFLEEAYQQHEADLRALSYDPRWEAIRGEPSFENLLTKVGLPMR